MRKNSIIKATIIKPLWYEVNPVILKELKKILITGGGGYVGSVLVEKLLNEGYQVVCLDRFFFGLEPISHLTKFKNFSYIKDDIRWFDQNILKDVYCVLDLASLSNDTTGELNPKQTMEINYQGRVRVAKLAKFMGVEKYILASTCSVYGFNEKICNENSPIDPLTTYAKASAQAEKDILDISSDKYACSSFRFATIYGPSKRMRFDLVVNTMTLSLFKNRKITVHGEGIQKRPLIDVRDACKAYLLGIKAEPELLNGQVFNVGSNNQNVQMSDLAKEIGDANKIDYKIESKGSTDFRSYHVDFSKIKKTFSFIPDYTPSISSMEIFNLLKNNSIDSGPKTITIDWYTHLIKNQKISLNNRS